MALRKKPKWQSFVQSGHTDHRYSFDSFIRKKIKCDEAAAAKHPFGTWALMAEHCCGLHEKSHNEEKTNEESPKCYIAKQPASGEHSSAQSSKVRVKLG